MGLRDDLGRMKWTPEEWSWHGDVMLSLRTEGERRAFVGEINAFGDLLPQLLHRGESAYTAIARACGAERCLT